jgi:hypothetical protein
MYLLHCMLRRVYVWSGQPAGGWLWVVSRCGVYGVQPRGGAARRLGLSKTSFFLSWLPLSSRLRAGSALLQEAQYIEYTLRVLE